MWENFQPEIRKPTQGIKHVNIKNREKLSREEIKSHNTKENKLERTPMNIMNT